MTAGTGAPKGAPLRVLIVEDSADDVLLLLRELRALGYEPEHAVADSAASVNRALDAGPWDVVLSDYAMPQFTGLEALRLVQRRALDIPFILISGAVGEEGAVAALKAGMHDYLQKGQLKRLGVAIERERREAQSRRERVASEQRYRSLFETMIEGVAVCRMLFEDGRPVDFVYLDVNPAFEKQTGLTGVVGRRVSDVIPGIHRSDPAVLALYARVCETGLPERAEMHLASLSTWFDVSAYRPMPEHFVAVFSNVTDRKLAEKKLADSRDFLDSIIESIADPVFVKDRAHRLVLVNEALCRLLGRPRADIVGKTDVELFPAEQAEVFWKHDDLVLASGREDVNEELVATATGENLTIVTKKTRYVARSGEAYLVGVIRDVTEGRRVEAERAKFALGLERSGDAIFVTTPEGTINYVNPAFERIYGYAKDEALGKTPRILKSGTHDRAFYEAFWRSLVSKEVLGGEIVNRTKSGELLHIDMNVYPIIDERGALLGFLAIHRDVTERKRTDDSLRASEERFRTLVGAMQDSVVTLDREGRVTSAFGAALPARSATEPFAGDTAAAHDEAFGAVLRGEVVDYEWTFEAGGVRRHVHTVASPLRDASGAVAGAVRVSRDVTELRKLQEQILLAERMSSMGTLAAGIAHEINNPLAALMANLDFAHETLTGETLGEIALHPRGVDALEALVESRHAAERVRVIVRDVKVFSRPDESRRVLVDLRQVLESSVRMVWNELRHRAALVRDHRPAPAVLANDARLGQVFVNLLMNAAHAIPEGNAGRNTITLRTWAEGSTRSVVEIADTGTGIAPEVMKKIFEPFFTTKPIGVGTGLGLAICQRIVSEFGGEITVRSSIGAGTCVRVVLPAASDEVGPQGPADLDPQPELRASILLVDDDPAVLKAVHRILGRRHRVVALMHAREALDRISAGEQFDLVVSDLMMPEMSGVDLYEALRRVSPEHARRMIFLTGGAFTATALTFLESVDNHRLEKPFDAATLLAVVSRSLGS